MNKKYINIIANKIKNERNNQNLLQIDLAKKSGISLRSVQNLESGQCCGFCYIIKVLDCLELDLKDILKT